MTPPGRRRGSSRRSGGGGGGAGRGEPEGIVMMVTAADRYPVHGRRGTASLCPYETTTMRIPPLLRLRLSRLVGRREPGYLHAGSLRRARHLHLVAVGAAV